MPRFMKRLRVTRLVGDKKYVVTIVEHQRDRAKDPKRGKGKPLPVTNDSMTGEEDPLYTPVYSVKSCEPAFMMSHIETCRLTPRKLKNRQAKKINQAKKELKAQIKAVDEVRLQRAEENLFKPLDKLVGKRALDSAPAKSEETRGYIVEYLPTRNSKRQDRLLPNKW